MARAARIVLPDLPYHVTHRGNRHGLVFESDADYESYLRLFSRYGERYGLALWAYCLMPNHVHLIVFPRRVDSLARTMRALQGLHAMNVNRRQGWSGHLWSNRFYSSPLDERHLWAAVRYVERNPVRAGLVRVAEDFRWSSAGAHCGRSSRAWLSPSRPFPGPVVDWRAWLSVEDEGPEEMTVRRRTARGLPAGSEAFVADLESRLGSGLRARPRGRPSTKGPDNA